MGENGSKLSGGQIQRIGIARALYFNPEILILDEITSSLDTITEQQILNVIKNLKKEMTIILITHRKSTMVICDEIFELNNKKIEKKMKYKKTNIYQKKFLILILTFIKKIK